METFEYIIRIYDQKSWTKNSEF